MSGHDKPVSPGTLLNELRWAGKTQAEKDAVGQALVEARRRKRLGKVRAKRAKALKRSTKRVR